MFLPAQAGAHFPHKQESTLRCHPPASLRAAVPPDWCRVSPVALYFLGPLGPDWSSSPGDRSAGQREPSSPPAYRHVAVEGQNNVDLADTLNSLY